MQIIKVGLTKKSQISDIDYDLVSQYRWHYHCGKAWSKEVGYLSRFLLRPSYGLVVDHIDGNQLNNQRENLRLATYAQNASNRRPSGKRIYKGVQQHRKKYEAKLFINGKPKKLGRFLTIEEAALAYNKAAIEQYGEFAYLNKIARS